MNIYIEVVYFIFENKFLIKFKTMDD